ncbi:MAG: nuclear transport factor 2 family protein [Sphingobium sp.]
MNDGNGNLQKNLQRIVDMEDIKTLMSKYCHGIDKKNEEMFMGIWAANGVYELPRGYASSTSQPS